MPDFHKDYVADPGRYDAMTYRRCGRSGLKLSAVSLGMWHNFGKLTPYETMRDIVCTAFDHGVTSFDLANNYGPEYGEAERSMGRLLCDYLRPYRDELVISTKAGYDMWPGPYGDHGSRKYLLASLDQSLERMGLDYVDIFYHHRMDPETPLEETMGALASAVEQGKALYVGLSRYDEPTLRRATAILEERHVPYVINQYRYNLLDRSIERDGTKAASAELGRGIITFSPLAQGLLTDRYLDGVPADSRMAHDPRYLKRSALTGEVHDRLVRLNKIAQARSQTLAEMALAWQLRDPAITSVLIGASRPEQVLDNIHALENRAFSADELAAIDEACLS